MSDPHLNLVHVLPLGGGEENVLVAQSCPTLLDPMACSPPDSSVHRILQARILEWVAIHHCIFKSS